MQCGPPPPNASTAPGTGDHLPAGERVGDQRQRVVLAGVATHGHDHAAVAQVQVQVARGDGLAGDLDVGQERQLEHVESGGSQARGVLGAVVEVRVARRHRLQQDLSGARYRTRSGRRGRRCRGPRRGPSPATRSGARPASAAAPPRSARATATGCGWAPAGTARWSAACPRRRRGSSLPRARSAPRSTSSPRRRAIAPPTSASWFHGEYFSPQPLKRKWTARRVPSSP